MSLPEAFKMPAYANLHSHVREDTDEETIVGPLVDHVVAGGADTILPMPNTKKGLTTAAEVLEYVEHLRRSATNAEELNVIPCMMANSKTPLHEFDRCVEAGIHDVKVYPLDRTTKSHNGVRQYYSLVEKARFAAKSKPMRWHFHPENPWMTVSNRDAEYMFLPIVDMLLNETDATIVWEHGTDSRCIPFWIEMAKSGRFMVTLTAHHLFTNEDKTFGDVRATCKPPIKTEGDRLALISLIDRGYSWVMAGPDDAPHPIGAKHVHSGTCACGAYTAPFQLQLYAQALEAMLGSYEGRINFQNFVGGNARFVYKLPPAAREVTLVHKPFTIPATYEAGTWIVEPFFAGQTLEWSLR